MNLADFHNLHLNQTCLLVGLGPNLIQTPPEWFDYPSFGINTVYKYEGWRPIYYVSVDHRCMVDDGAKIVEAYRDIPKFVPTPDYDGLQGDNFYRFKHRRGEMMEGGKGPGRADFLTKCGVGYYRIMDAVIQIAYHMGFRTMLMIGVQHKPQARKLHFWGADEKAPDSIEADTWEFIGYKFFSHDGALDQTRILNISEDTFVPENILPRDDWRKWRNN